MRGAGPGAARPGGNGRNGRGETRPAAGRERHGRRAERGRAPRLAPPRRGEGGGSRAAASPGAPEPLRAPRPRGVLRAPPWSLPWRSRAGLSTLVGFSKPPRVPLQPWRDPPDPQSARGPLWSLTCAPKFLSHSSRRSPVAPRVLLQLPLVLPHFPFTAPAAPPEPL